MRVERNLVGKKVLVGVTGSIAIYKSLQLIRYLVKSGAEVRVIMSDSAKKFITPLTFETISRNRVLFDGVEDWSSDFNHIQIGKWADTFVIAPATANTINKLANGIADTTLLQTALAYGREILISPSANTTMLYNPISEANIKLLKLAGYTFIGTERKELACRVEGDGAMAEPEEIYFQVTRSLLKTAFWTNRRVVVSGGGTVEKIDEVRYISNFSSGKMASSLAKSLYFSGADVCFVSTKFPETLPKEMCQIDVESADEMKLYLEDSIRIAKKGVLTKPTLLDSSEVQNIQKKPYLFMASAVSDYKPKFKQEGKLKSHQIGESWSLELSETVDILETISKDGIFAIGFKAEMDRENGEKFAKEMLIRKELNGVCLNILEDSNSFGTDSNEVTFITKDSVATFERASKLEISQKIVDSAEKLEVTK
jgi:phosphopantothenoylcysteine decarboxylase/phosphopantothenate--cysteine ligase